jgi:hypothetical protein
MSEQKQFRWPDHIWTILPDGETKYWARCLIDYDQASYTREEETGMEIETFCPEDLGKKCFRTEFEAIYWLQLETYQFYKKLDQKKHEALNRIARP